MTGEAEPIMADPYWPSKIHNGLVNPEVKVKPISQLKNNLMVNWYGLGISGADNSNNSSISVFGILLPICRYHTLDRCCSCLFNQAIATLLYLSRHYKQRAEKNVTLLY